MPTERGPAKAKSTPQSKRGGSRPGAGRKPKAIAELRESLIVPMVPPEGQTISDVKSAAEFALALFEGTMRDELKPIDLRLDCAREVLNRTIGRPRMANEAAPADLAGDGGGGICVYMPDNGRTPQGS